MHQNKYKYTHVEPLYKKNLTAEHLSIYMEYQKRYKEMMEEYRKAWNEHPRNGGWPYKISEKRSKILKQPLIQLWEEFKTEEYREEHMLPFMTFFLQYIDRWNIDYIFLLKVPKSGFESREYKMKWGTTQEAFFRFWDFLRDETIPDRVKFLMIIRLSYRPISNEKLFSSEMIEEVLNAIIDKETFLTVAAKFMPIMIWEYAITTKNISLIKRLVSNSKQESYGNRHIRTLILQTRDEDVVRAYISNNFHLFGKYLTQKWIKYFKTLDKQTANEISIRFPHVVRFIDPKFEKITDDAILRILKKSGLFIKSIPSSRRTEEFYGLAFAKSPSLLMSFTSEEIPERVLIRMMLLNAESKKYVEEFRRREKKRQEKKEYDRRLRDMAEFEEMEKAARRQETSIITN